MLLNFSLPIPRLEIAGWQWIFLLNVPIGIVTLLLIYVVAGGIETPRVRAGLDLVGAVLLSVALVAGIGGDHRLRATGWTDPLVIGGWRWPRDPSGPSSGGSCERPRRSSTSVSSPTGHSPHRTWSASSPATRSPRP